MRGEQYGRDMLTNGNKDGDTDDNDVESRNSLTSQWGPGLPLLEVFHIHILFPGFKSCRK